MPGLQSFFFLIIRLRVVAWIKLVKAWRGTLRWDDVQKISPSELRYSGNRLTAILRVTKTTGPTKRVQELPLCISEFPYIPSPFWLKTGFDLLREGADFRRDAKEAGGRKTLLSPDFFFRCRPSKQAVQARQANTSQGQPPMPNDTQ